MQLVQFVDERGRAVEISDAEIASNTAPTERQAISIHPLLNDLRHAARETSKIQQNARMVLRMLQYSKSA